MKKTSFGAALIFFAAAVGALTAAALYLHHREQELDEYEKLLFTDEYDDDSDAEKLEDDPSQENDPGQEDETAEVPVETPADAPQNTDASEKDIRF